MPYYTTDRVFFALFFGIPMLVTILVCEYRIHRNER